PPARPAPAVVSGSSAPGPTLCDVDDLLLRRILTGDDPAVLVAVALAAADRPLERASALAADARAPPPGAPPPPRSPRGPPRPPPGRTFEMTSAMPPRRTAAAMVAAAVLLNLA